MLCPATDRRGKSLAENSRRRTQTATGSCVDRFVVDYRFAVVGINYRFIGKQIEIEQCKGEKVDVPIVIAIGRGATSGFIIAFRRFDERSLDNTAAGMIRTLRLVRMMIVVAFTAYAGMSRQAGRRPMMVVRHDRHRQHYRHCRKNE